MEGDISKKTILVLVVLTIIISVLGTLTVLDAVNRLDSSEDTVVVPKETQAPAQVYVNMNDIDSPVFSKEQSMFDV